MKNRLCFMVLALSFFLIHQPSVAHGVTIDLYDNSLYDLPEDQSPIRLFYAGFGGSRASVTVAGEKFINLDSTIISNAAQAGYGSFLPGFPSMDRHRGFSIEFDLSLISESHDRTDRAGFSIIALSQDVQGIELGFWADEIWAQEDSPLFTHGETTIGFDPTDGVITYTLNILNNGYSLFADNTPILSGGLRDYSAWPGPLSPYSLSNYLFFGDNTTSASANVNLGKITLKTELAPEPATFFLIGFGLIGIAGLGRRRSELKQLNRPIV